MADIQENNEHLVIEERLKTLERQMRSYAAKKDYRKTRVTIGILVLAILVAMTTAVVSPGTIIALLFSNDLQNALQQAPNATLNVTPGRVSENLMTLFLVVAAGGIAYLASMMGMRRLETYDTQFNEFRGERRAFEQKFEDKFAQELSRITDQVAAGVKDQLKTTSEELADEARERESIASEALADQSKAVREMSDTLRHDFSMYLQSDVAQSVLIDRPSVREILATVRRSFSQNEPPAARSLVRDVLRIRNQNTGELVTTGLGDDWFNLGAELGRQGEYNLGMRVNVQGLVQSGAIKLAEGSRVEVGYPVEIDPAAMPQRAQDGTVTWWGTIPNVDLLMHGISYGRNIGQTSLVEQFVQIATCLPESKRNWRYYTFLSAIYEERDDEARFFELIEEFKERIPSDERSVGKILEWYKNRSKMDKFFDIGEEWLSNSKGRGTSVPLRLATEALEEKRYGDTLRYTDAALEGSAESQPNAAIGSMLFYRANAFDGLFMRQAARREGRDVDAMKRYYASAVRLYQSPLTGDIIGIMRNASKSRLQVMRLAYLETGEALPEGLDAPVESAPSAQNGSDAELQGALNAGLQAYLKDDKEMFDKAVAIVKSKGDAMTAKSIELLAGLEQDETKAEDVRTAAKAFRDALAT